MDTFLDQLWEYIAAGFTYAGELLYSLLQHLHFIGPTLLLFFIAFFTVCITKILKKVIVTKRYVALEKEYQHWFQLRQEAMQFKDSEIAKRMARNIDQAELNKAYYDYFFEGFLLNVVRKVFPIFFVFTFVNEYYRPERMLENFGQNYVFSFGTTSSDPTMIGGTFWFFISLLISYLLFAVVGKITFIDMLSKKLFLKKQSDVSQSHC